MPQPCLRSHSKQFYRASGLAGGAAVSPTQLHLVRRGEQYWLIFDAAETKTREPVEAPFPIALTPYLERYLSFYRPVLATDVGPRKSRTRAIRQESLLEALDQRRARLRITNRRVTLMWNEKGPPPDRRRPLSIWCGGLLEPRRVSSRHQNPTPPTVYPRLLSGK